MHEYLFNIYGKTLLNQVNITVLRKRLDETMWCCLNIYEQFADTHL